MAASGLQWQTLHLSLGGGLDTKDDVRAADPRQMDIARDVQFDELRGAQTRKPFVDFGSAVLGGPPLANCRRLAAVNGELLVFTDTELLSWNEALEVWVPRGTHLAVNASEASVLVGTGDQLDADRAELDGTIIYAWTDAAQVYAAAIDKATGSMLVGPTAVSTAVGRPRLVALDSRILLFVDAGFSSLHVRAIDPGVPGTAIGGAGTVVASGVFNAFYDVVKVDGQDLAVGAYRRGTTTSYSVFNCTPALTVTTVTKARTTDGPVAVVTTPGGGAQVQVVRANGTNILGDLLTTSTLADVFTAQAIGTTGATPVNQVTVAYGTSTTATAFWTWNESVDGTNGSTVRRNTVTTTNVVGVQSSLVLLLGVASRAFTYDGHAYVWLVFACDSQASGFGVPLGIRAQLQNTYFLYRDDGLLVARAADEVAGGFSPSAGRLPGVAQIGDAIFAWCGTSRRIIDLGGADHTGFGARSPHDIIFTFDDDAARRCAALGRTLYVAGSIPIQYDGAELVEVGFLIYPFVLVGANTSVGAGAIPAGKYSYKSTMRWPNALGEQERSTTAIGLQITSAANSKNAIVTIALNVTLKAAARVAPAIEIWRTTADPQLDNPFFLITSKDPSVLSGDNRYIANDVTLNQDPPVGFVDNFTDAILTTKEANPENGAVLESLAPPGAAIIIATDTRIFLAGISGDPDSVWYSRLRATNEVASFHDGNVIPVPREGGAITALAFLNETLVVFRETAVYALPGQGFDNLGQGQNFGPANRLAPDVGAVSAEAVVLTPMGLVFKSRKGWYLLDRGWGVKYIGAQVSAFDGDVVRSAHVVETQHHVRILTSGRLLVWDYYNTTESAPMGQWMEWTITDGVHAVIWNGSYVYLTPTGPKIERTDYAGVNYGADVESSWIKFSDLLQGILQGAARVRWFEALGEFRSPFFLRVRVAKDYEYDGSGNPVYFDDTVWPVTPEVVGSALQVRHTPSVGQMEAIKVRLTAVSIGGQATLSPDGDGPIILTDGLVWQPVLMAIPLGEMGNRVTLSLSFEEGVPFVVDVRDHFFYDLALGRWRELLNNIGIRVACSVGSSPTVAQLEAAVAAGSMLATVSTPDPSPAKIVDAGEMIGSFVTGQFGDLGPGTYVAPGGEACKLTGIDFEVGLTRGLFRRLPAENKQ